MKLNISKLILTIVVMLVSIELQAQYDTTEYRITISEKKLNITGKDRKALAVDNQIPGPTLRFKEGGYAVIYVKNDLEVETSVHWHGLILPKLF